MSLPDLSSTPRTALHRHSERAQTDRDELYAVLDAGLICHLGVVADGVPRVLPTGYGRVGETLYLHGSSANATFMAGGGQEVCVTVTHLDGLVCARSVFTHSMNYRSAMIFGVARLVTEADERLEGAPGHHRAPGSRAVVLRAPAHQEGAGRYLGPRAPAHRGLGQGSRRRPVR